MALVEGSLYLALREAGASHERAEAAARVYPDTETRAGRPVNLGIPKERGSFGPDLEARLMRLEKSVRMTQWMVTIVLALSIVALLLSAR